MASTGNKFNALMGCLPLNIFIINVNRYVNRLSVLFNKRCNARCLFNQVLLVRIFVESILKNMLTVGRENSARQSTTTPSITSI